MQQANIAACTCRGKYDGPEPQRLAVLKYAARLGASHVDVELKVATYFFAGMSCQQEDHSVVPSLHSSLLLNIIAFSIVSVHHTLEQPIHMMTSTHATVVMHATESPGSLRPLDIYACMCSDHVLIMSYGSLARWRSSSCRHQDHLVVPQLPRYSFRCCAGQHSAADVGLWC